MKSDEELLEELVEYFYNVMVDTDEGEPFEDREVPDTVMVEVDELDMTDDRGGGFGHTNKQQMICYSSTR